jgi:bacillolysin
MVPNIIGGSFMKRKILAMLLIITMLISVPSISFADTVEGDVIVSLGENLTEQQEKDMLAELEVPENAQMITVSNKEEHDYLGEFIDFFNQLTPTSVDGGGVRVNSSITNHAAYLIGQEIGRNKLGQIYYLALTVYLTPNSDFSDARKAIVQSTIDLYGEGSDEVAATNAGFDAVGIY